MSEEGRMDHDLKRAKRAALWVGLIVPLVLTAIAAALLIAWLPRMPDPAATHWSGGGRPDGFGAPGTNAGISLGIGLGLIAVFQAVPLLERLKMGAPVWTAVHRLFPAFCLATVALIQLVAVITARVQLDLDDAREAPGVGGWMIASGGTALVAGVIGYLAQPRVRIGARETADSTPLPLRETERAVWVGEIRPSAVFLWALIPAILLVSATAVWLFLIGTAVWIPTGVLAVLMIVLAVTTCWFRVRIDASGVEARSLVGWPVFRVPADAVERVTVREIRPFGEFGGWGTRWMPGTGLGIVMGGGDGIVVTRRDGRIFALSIDDAETAAALLTAAADARPREAGSARTRTTVSHSDRPDRLDRVPWGAVVLFVVLSFGLSWLVALPLWLTGPGSASFQMLFGIVAAAAMFTPALATLVVVFATRTPRSDRLRFLGVWPLRPAKRVVWFTVTALFAPLVIGIATTLIAAEFGWVRLDLVGFSGFAEANAAALPEGVDPGILPPPGALIAIQLALFPIAALIPNSILGFGEEIGWRGWLLPALRPLGVWPALILSGAIWGLWHAPLTLLGHNYGLMDWRGVALMTVNCVVWGVLFGWLRLRSGSVWPAVVGHGAMNGTGGMILWFIAAGVEVNAALVTVAGVSGWIVFGVIIAVLAATGQFRREPELAPDRGA